MLKKIFISILSLFVIYGAAEAQAPRNIKRDVIDARVSNAAPSTTLMVATGTGPITPSGGSIIIDVTGGSALTINNVVTTSYQAGDTIKIEVASGDALTFNDAVGNIQTDTGASVTIDGDKIGFIHVTASGVKVSLGGGSGQPNYLGSSASAPTTDLTGAALNGDEIYYNTSTLNWYQYNNNRKVWYGLNGGEVTFDGDLLFTAGVADGLTIVDVGGEMRLTRAGGAPPVVEGMTIFLGNMAVTANNARPFRVASRSGSYAVIESFNGGPTPVADAGPNETATITHFRGVWNFAWDGDKGTLFPSFEVNCTFSICKPQAKSLIMWEAGDSGDLAMGRACGDASNPTACAAGRVGFYAYFQNYDDEGNFIPQHGLTNPVGGASLNGTLPYMGRAAIYGGITENVTDTERGTAIVFSPVREATVVNYDAGYFSDESYLVLLGKACDAAAYPFDPTITAGQEQDKAFTKFQFTNIKV